MNFKFILAIALIFGFFSAEAQTDGGRTSNTKVIKVKNDIYMLQGKGGNIGFSVGKDGVLMIDSQFADASEDIIKDIKRISKKPIHLLLNTHAHGDHTGGNANFAKEGASIIAHSGVRRSLEGKKNASKEAGASSDVDEKAFPVITFDDKMNIYFNGDNILVMHLEKAHTNGDAIVYFMDSDVLHTGDVFFNGKYPYIDVKSGGSLDGYINGLSKILMVAEKETKIIPGHGEIGTLIEVDASLKMLRDLKRQVTFHFLKGKTEAEIIAMRDFTKAYDDLGFGDGFISTEKILKTIYDAVAKERADFDPRNMSEIKKELETKYGRDGSKRELKAAPQPTKEQQKEIKEKESKEKEGRSN